MKGKKVRVALAQFEAVLGDVAQNLQNGISLVEQAAAGNADVIVFPELCFTGYQLQLLGKQVHSLSDAWNAEIERTLKKAAQTANLNIITGLCEKIGSTYYNTACLYNRQGERAGCHRKNFAFGAERDFFSDGQELRTFDTDFGRIGILICYDIGFPETARRLSLAGAEILFFPSAWRVEDERAWELNVASRALENQVYTVAVNHAGMFGGLHLFGRSCACGPDGNVLVQLGYDRQELQFCDLDLSVLNPLHRSPGYRFDLAGKGAF